MKNEQAKGHPELIEEISVLKRRIKELEQSEPKRKYREEALRESEERFATIFNTAERNYNHRF
jgi:hypothetical protein